MRQATNFFRLHDSGDFFSTVYLDAWVEIAARFPSVSFWAPTRTWMLKSFANHILAGRKRAPNLVIRPSALQFDDPAPLVSGHAAGSTAHRATTADALEPKEIGLAAWDCPAYALATKSCAGAMDLSNIKEYVSKKTTLSVEEQRQYLMEARANFKELFGREAPVDCRVCWKNPQTSVSYHAH